MLLNPLILKSMGIGPALDMARPWQSRQEFLTDQALQSAISDPETIRKTRPVVPQQLFPEREGFSKQEGTIQTILNIDRYMPTKRSWLSGMPVMRTSIEDGSFEGSGRYSMNSMWGG